MSPCLTWTITPLLSHQHVKWLSLSPHNKDENLWKFCKATKASKHKSYCLWAPCLAWTITPSFFFLLSHQHVKWLSLSPHNKDENLWKFCKATKASKHVKPLKLRHHNLLNKSEMYKVKVNEKVKALFI